MKLAPAILQVDRVAYEENMAMARQMADRVQVDIIDGVFARNHTVSLGELSPIEGIMLDLDLMVAQPSQFIDDALKLRPHLVIFHLECQEDLRPSIAKVRAAGIEAGVGINPQTTVDEIEPPISQLDHVLIMGYSAGFAGQQFQSEVLNKVGQIRSMNNGVEIGLDGGVTALTIEQIRDAGVDIAYINTAIFEHPQPLAQFKNLQEMAK